MLPNCETVQARLCLGTRFLGLGNVLPARGQYAISPAGCGKREIRMGSGGDFPIDLVLLGGIAAFLVLRLRSILGRREGFERPTEAAPGVASGPVPAANLAPTVPSRAVPDPASVVGQALLRMVALDPGFQPDRFLEGAEGAFRIIVTAFAAGDRVRLHPLLSDETYKAFEGAIAAREANGETQSTDIRAIPSATIEEAVLHDRTAAITVHFVSDQVNLTHDRNGAPVVGTDAVTEITDMWTFERVLGTSDPTWRLVAARSA